MLLPFLLALIIRLIQNTNSNMQIYKSYFEILDVPVRVSISTIHVGLHALGAPPQDHLSSSILD
jgi:hypothetical protein